METGTTSGKPAKKRSGFLTFLYFFLGLGAVLVLVGGVAAFLFLRSEQGRRMLALARETGELLVEASQAPGMEDLRGAGCEQALAAPAGRVVELLDRFDPEGGLLAEGRSMLGVSGLGDGTPVVLCMQRPGQAGTPDCETAARLYAAAQAAPPERFVVLMVPRRGHLAGCSGVYAPDGTRVGDLPEPPEEPAAPAPGEAPTAEPPEAPAGAGTPSA